MKILTAQEASRAWELVDDVGEAIATLQTLYGREPTEEEIFEVMPKRWDDADAHDFASLLGHECSQGCDGCYEMRATAYRRTFAELRRRQIWPVHGVYHG